MEGGDVHVEADDLTLRVMLVGIRLAGCVEEVLDPTDVVVARRGVLVDLQCKSLT